MITANQNPEQLVRDQIDQMLHASGWQVQSKKQINLAAGRKKVFSLLCMETNLMIMQLQSSSS